MTDRKNNFKDKTTKAFRSGFWTALLLVFSIAICIGLAMAVNHYLNAL